MTHICIIVGRFYEDIADELVQGASQHLGSASATYDLITVPGAFEIPAVVSIAIASRKYDGYVTLGCVIRGETTHYDYVCGESARGLNALAIAHNAAIGYGILTVETMGQAWERARITEGNKGKDAAVACLRMIAIKQELLA
jgi:6,7-dimethyl-8-ribityllumazine synthase